MHKITVIIIYLFSLSCNTRGGDSIPAATKLLSKTYSAKFAVQQYFYTTGDSLSTASRFTGILRRTPNYIYSKSGHATGILEDSTCLMLDSFSKIMTVGPIGYMEAYLVTPIYDPNEILAYATKYKLALLKYYEGDKVIFDYIFGDNSPMINLIFTFNYSTANSNSFSATIIYQRRSQRIKDVIHYEFVSAIAIQSGKNIGDFVEHKDGKYFAKKEFSDFVFFNLFYPILK